MLEDTSKQLYFSLLITPEVMYTDYINKKIIGCDCLDNIYTCPICLFNVKFLSDVTLLPTPSDVDYRCTFNSLP